MIQTPNVIPGTTAAAPDVTRATQVLADALRMVRLKGAVYMRGEFTTPWGFVTPPLRHLVEALAPEAEHLVVFHSVIEGTCEFRIEGGEPVRAEAGEFVILPYAEQHTMASPDATEAVPIAELLPEPPWPDMLVAQLGLTGGSHTRVLCSYLDCSDIIFNPMLAALPRILKVSPRPGPGAEWLKAGMRYSAGLTPDAIGRDAIGSRLPELLLVETLRQYLVELPREQTGWLGALSDPVIGDALLRMHGEPSRSWTVAALAEDLAVSRTALARRFSERLGQSPMRYLAQWRGQLAGHLLQTTDLPVRSIATRVGYQSEAAFSRAFKRSSGMAPGAWRNRTAP